MLIHRNPVLSLILSAIISNIPTDNTPYEKVGDAEPVSIAEEVPFEIPETWEWIHVGEIFAHNTGKALNASNRTGQLLSYITTSNLYWNRFELASLREMYFTDAEIEKCTATKGDLLVCEGGDFGRAAIWPYDYDIRIQNHIHKLRAFSPVCTEFFYYLFYLYKHAGWIGGKGIGIQGLSANALHALIFPLPPLEEQYRIVELIHGIMPYIDHYAEVEKDLDTLNTGFPDQLRKSILQLAVQGKLVPQDPSDEPASLLLDRIRAEKERLIVAGKIKRDKHESVIFRRDNSHYEKSGGMERCIDEELPFDIPDSWCWARLGCLLEELTSGSRDWAKYYSTDGAIFLRMGNLSKNSFRLRLEKIQRVSLPDNAEGKRTSLQPGDLLFSITADIGNMGLIPEGFGEAYINQHTAMLRFISVVRNEYIPYCLLCDYAQRMYKRQQHGIKNSFRLDTIQNILIPLPPLQEQRRILKRLSDLFAIDMLSL